MYYRNVTKTHSSALNYLYKKDDWEFVQILPRSLTFDSDIYSCDIGSLYTSVPTEFGLETIEYWIMRKRDVTGQRFAKEFILESNEFILRNNSFLFDSKMFNQIIGTKHMLCHTHVSPLVIKKKLNCLRKGCQNIFPMKSIY